MFKFNFANPLLIVLIAALLSGCGTKNVTYSSAAYESEQQLAIQELETELQLKEQSLRAYEEKLQAKEADLVEKQNKVSDIAEDEKTSNLFPPNPKPGECYARVLIPGQYETKKYRVLSREASERIDIIPAQYRTVEKRVLVREAGQNLVQVPAQYKTVTERVLDKPAHTVWKKGDGIGSGTVLSKKYTDTGEVVCLVEVPATYKTVTKQILTAPAVTQVVEVPAQYKTVEVNELIAPAREQRIEIPALYETITKTEKVSSDFMEWRQVVCKINFTEANVSRLQRALKQQGYYNDNVDGLLGPNTLKAANNFAKNRSLPQGSNYIAKEVVSALGLQM